MLALRNASGPESLAPPGDRARPTEILPEPLQRHHAEGRKLGPTGIHPNTAAHFWNILEKKKRKHQDPASLCDKREVTDGVSLWRLGRQGNDEGDFGRNALN
ncbi:hypothetical protein CapIbe_018404 [Capra ibex]